MLRPPDNDLYKIRQRMADREKKSMKQAHFRNHTTDVTYRKLMLSLEKNEQFINRKCIEMERNTRRVIRDIQVYRSVLTSIPATEFGVLKRENRKASHTLVERQKDKIERRVLRDGYGSALADSIVAIKAEQANRTPAEDRRLRLLALCKKRSEKLVPRDLPWSEAEREWRRAPDLSSSHPNLRHASRWVFDSTPTTSISSFLPKITKQPPPLDSTPPLPPIGVTPGVQPLTMSESVLAGRRTSLSTKGTDTPQSLRASRGPSSLAAVSYSTSDGNVSPNSDKKFRPR